MSQAQEYLLLMQQMGAERWEGFNPIAPRSHRWLMDISQPEVVRVAGWALWRTIDRDPHGKVGPPKKTRTAIAHDTRCRKGAWLGVKQVAEDLHMSLANASDAVRRGVEAGYIRVDEDGRISPRGDAPLPRRMKGESNENEDERLFCTENILNDNCLHFQQLDKKRRWQWVRLYLSAPDSFRAHLEALPPDTRPVHTWRYLTAAEIDEQLQADAIAAARAAGREIVDRVCAEAGYADGESRGRKPVARPLAIQIKICIDTEKILSVQKNGSNFVQNGNPNSYKTENGGVQNAASLLTSSPVPGVPTVSEWRGETVENEAPRPGEKEAAAPHSSLEPTPPSAPLTQNLDQIGKDASDDPLADPNLVVDAVQHFFHRKLGSADPLRQKFAELAPKCGIPAAAVWQFLGEKFDRKRSRRYTIDSPGALYQMAEADLPGWIQTHGREIDAARQWEQEQTSSAGATAAAAAESVRWQERQRKRLADPRTPEAEKRAIAEVLAKFDGESFPEAEPFDPLSYNAEMKALAAKKEMP